jgi:hypothetical protein
MDSLRRRQLLVLLTVESACQETSSKHIPFGVVLLSKQKPDFGLGGKIEP